eukprot:7750597-Heterocapsa_arctica.AAC.1
MLSTPLLAEQAAEISVITHVTKTIHLANMFRLGLAPGGIDLRRGSIRNASNFNTFLPDDPRNIVSGRDSAEHDAVIVFKTAELVAGFNMTISHN